MLELQGLSQELVSLVLVRPDDSSPVLQWDDNPGEEDDEVEDEDDDDEMEDDDDDAVEVDE